VELRVVLEVLGLEVVGPQHPQVLLHEVRPLLLDGDRAILEDRVVGALVLLLAGLHGLRLDTGLRRIVDAARQIAVSVDGPPRLEECFEHGSASSDVG
jgi:hypothetical protein